jgi:hypothetical protein
MKLYEISAMYKSFIDMIENEEVPQDAIEDTLECITAEIEDKADNIACLIKNLTAEAEAIKLEEQNLAKRRKSKESRIEWLKSYLTNNLIANGLIELETARNKITFRSSERVAFEDEKAFIEWAMTHNEGLLTYKAPTVNKTEIKKAITGGTALDGVRIEKCQNIQIK